jgi:outer membrane receptor protein involved in Fe transport
MLLRSRAFVRLTCSTAAAIALATPIAVHAQQRLFQLDIPAQDLGSALKAVAGATGQQVVFKGATVKGKRGAALKGSYTIDDAIGALIRGQGLQTSRSPRGVIVVEPAVIASAASDPSDSPEDVLVTGTRIKGAVTASPKITITYQQIREEGQTDLGQVIRDIPQNFSGGQNPGVLSSAGGTNVENQNVGGGSAFDLRGLGPGATLTLLNGKRLSYSGFSNAIDISAIPVAALDRIDVVTDGASAIYGSDAVAGVANVILRRDYDGLTTALRGGTTTRGGGSDYQLSLTGGKTWQSGGFLLAYDRGHADAIFARDRKYITGLDDPTSLFPELSHDSIVFSGHQSLSSAVTLSLDALYTRRADDAFLTFADSLYPYGFREHAFTISPALDVDLSGGWTARLTGTYGRDKNHVYQSIIDTTTEDLLYRATGCYCNTTQIAELGAEGPLFALPGGDVRIAVGAGYRRNAFTDSSADLSGNHSSYGGVDSSSYAYGEINVPIVSPAMNVAAIQRLNLSGAIRYEKYRRISGTATPKIGLVYEPTSDFSVKGSWGRSFKVATLAQQFQQGYGELDTASGLGGTGYPPGATAIYLEGPNPNLRPERAESWTGTFAIHPEKIAGLSLEISYFNVDYTDRIISPVGNIFTALSEPAYAPYVTLAPTAAQITAALASAGTSFYNQTGGDPYAAVAIVDSSLTNAARDHVSGVDVTGSYHFGVGGGDLTIRGSGSWLKGHRELLKNSPTLKTAGVIFNPPDFRGRAGITWDKGGFGFAAFLNHLDGVFANYLVVQAGKTGSFDTVDLNIRYALPEKSGLLSGLEFALTIDNVLDAKPPLFQVSYAGLPNYDSTNYSSIGRTVSFTVTKKW